MNSLQQQIKNIDILVCPETKQKLIPFPLVDAELMLEETNKFTGGQHFGPSPTILLREDLKAAYPIVDGIPVLLVPEMLIPSRNTRKFDLTNPKYFEAYQEMPHYSKIAFEEAQNITEANAYKIIEIVLRASDQERLSFPHPRNVWIDATYDCAAQWDAYEHVAPVEGKRILQLGGKGIHAVKFLLAGAKECWLVSPMIGELKCALALAQAADFTEGLSCVLAIGEELPFASNTFHSVYSGGCIHHTVTDYVLPECARILRDGGKFAAVDPWKAPLYTIGTTIFGKRVNSVHCKPLTKERVNPLYTAFKSSTIIHHGTLTRYPLLALNKLGLSVKLSTVWWLNYLDDKICSPVPRLRNMGSSIALLGEA
jgi:uncharacterized protein YbaR (Trm112 family)